MIKTGIDEVANLPPRPLENLSFQSRSEYACAKMMGKYMGWKGIEGVTFQILVGRALYDFRIGDVFIEYHPISLRREFLTDALAEIMPILQNLKRHDKIAVLESINKELFAQYVKRRGQTLAAHPSYGSMELICANSPEMFFDKVIFRFATMKCPSALELGRDFRKLQKEFKPIC
jgi:hypothetical protein